MARGGRPRASTRHGILTRLRDRLRRVSLKSRVTLLTTAAVGLSILFVAAGVYWTVRVQLTTSLDYSLTHRAKLAAASPTLQELGIQLEIPPAYLGAADIRIAFVYADGHVFIPDNEGPFPVLAQPELNVATGATKRSIRTLRVRGSDHDYRVVTVPTSTKGQALVVAQSLVPQERLLRRLGIVMAGFGIFGAIVAGFAGFGVASSGLRPVRRLTQRVEDIARTEDLSPIPVEGADDIARLAKAFNGLLTALDGSRERQRQLIADAGHELRTPLTSMRTNIDLLTQADLSLTAEQRSELLGDVRAQMSELTTLIGDLVELARDEPIAPIVEAVELHEVVERALARVRRRKPSVSFVVHLQPWWVVGEANTLERAVTNLLDNAAKWSPEDGKVTVTLVDGVLTVDDHGPGISDEDLPHVFDRFYRSAESRGMPGSGLGLAIVHQTAERHAGSVTASRNSEGGAHLVLRLPGSGSPMPAAKRD